MSISIVQNTANTHTSTPQKPQSGTAEAEKVKKATHRRSPTPSPYKGATTRSFSANFPADQKIGKVRGRTLSLPGAILENPLKKI